MAPVSIELAAGNCSLLLCPAIGGSIARFRIGARDIFRPAAQPIGAAADARAMACYPLVPYSNRMAGGGFAFGGRRIDLRRNVDWDPYPLHGVGWQRPWRVERAGDAGATLAYTHAPDADWPFAFHAEQHFALTHAGLAVTLSVANTGAALQPAGIGLHPFWPLTADTTLTASLRGVWMADARRLPIVETPLPPRWDFAAPRRLADAHVDHCFTGWAGTARLAWPDLVVDLHADAAFGHLVIASPLAAGECAVEPVSHANDGFNRAAVGNTDTGVRVLAPGQRLGGTVRFAVRQPD